MKQVNLECRCPRRKEMSNRPLFFVKMSVTALKAHSTIYPMIRNRTNKINSKAQEFLSIYGRYLSASQCTKMRLTHIWSQSVFTYFQVWAVPSSRGRLGWTCLPQFSQRSIWGGGWFSFTWDIWLCSFGCWEGELLKIWERPWISNHIFSFLVNRYMEYFTVSIFVLVKRPPLQEMMLEKSACPTYKIDQKCQKERFPRFPRVSREWSRQIFLGLSPQIPFFFPPQFFSDGDATGFKKERSHFVDPIGKLQQVFCRGCRD